MKGLQFKLDILGGLIVALGGLICIFGPLFIDLWIIDAGGVVMILGFIIFAGSDRIARIFVKD